MMEMLVQLLRPADREKLAARLANLVEPLSITRGATRNEIRVRAPWESRAIVAVIGAVEAWLAEEPDASAVLSIGDRSFAMPR